MTTLSRKQSDDKPRAASEINDKNPYFCKSKLSGPKYKPILRYFALDWRATDTTELMNFSARSINAFATLPAVDSAKVSPFSAQLEADESCFGEYRVRGKRGRGIRQPSRSVG